MRTFMKYSNIILFIVVATLGVILFPSGKITQEVLDLFPKTKDREVIDIYREFASSHYVFSAIKGFDEDSKKTLDSFLDRIQTLPNVRSTHTSVQATQALQDFIATHYIAVATPNENLRVFTSQEITKKITQGVQSLLKAKSAKSQDSSFNPNDPLGAFFMPSNRPQELQAKDYGLIGLIELESLEDKDIKATIEGFEEIANDYPNIRYFSQNFMESINLDLILKEVSFLLTFASVAFVVLYFVIIRIPMLTLNTIATLVMANIVAMFIVQWVYPKVTIMALSFGMGISNIAIDYMMHHNFFSLYARKGSFNKAVFYGYITTIVGFGICLFIPFPLLAQLSLYAIISLSVSYCFFAFLYPRIRFNAPRFFPSIAKWQRSKIPNAWFLGLCMMGFIFVGLNLKFDFDLSKLGYENKTLLAEKDFFDSAYNHNQAQILLSSQSTQGLLALANMLQMRLNTKAPDSKSPEDALKESSFIPLSIIPSPSIIEEKKAFLHSKIMHQNTQTLLTTLPYLQASLLAQSSDKSYQDSIHALFKIMRQSYEIKKLDNLENLNLKDLQNLGFNIIESDGRFYYLAMINRDDMPLIQSLIKELQDATDQSHIESRSLQSILDNLANSIVTPMLLVLGVALIAMLATLAITAREAFLECVVFILFPLCGALCVIASHSTLNIMHLFALLILVVVSVDYGIYSAKEGLNLRTSHAIFFSAITTGLSFGILMTSKTTALNSFGEVIFTGMCGILILLFFGKIKRKR